MQNIKTLIFSILILFMSTSINTGNTHREIIIKTDVIEGKPQYSIREFEELHNEIREHIELKKQLDSLNNK